MLRNLDHRLFHFQPSSGSLLESGPRWFARPRGRVCWSCASARSTCCRTPYSKSRKRRPRWWRPSSAVFRVLLLREQLQGHLSCCFRQIVMNSVKYLGKQKNEQSSAKILIAKIVFTKWQTKNYCKNCLKCNMFSSVCFIYQASCDCLNDKRFVYFCQSVQYPLIMPNVKAKMAEKYQCIAFCKNQDFKKHMLIFQNTYNVT